MLVLAVAAVEGDDGVCEVGEIGWALARSAYECENNTLINNMV